MRFVVLSLALAGCGRDAAVESGPSHHSDAAGMDANIGAMSDAGAAAANDAAVVQTPDAGSAADVAPVESPRRILIVLNQLGMWRRALVMKPQGADDDKGWEHDLRSDAVAWSPMLEPFKAFRSNLVVVDGLAVHTVIQQDTRDPQSDMATAALTGDILKTHAAQFPSLDFLLGQAQPAPAKGLLLFGFGSSSFDASLKRIKPAGSGAEAHANLFAPPPPGCTPPPAPPARAATGNLPPLPQWIDEFLPVITGAFECDVRRVVSVQLPLPGEGELGLPGNIEQDFTDVVGPDVDPMAPPTAIEGTKRFNVYNAQQVARFVAHLSATREGLGTLLDNTLVVWMSQEATPGHGNAPWNMVIVAGDRVGLKTGRYVRAAQSISTTLPFGAGTAVFGPPHNHALVSLARLMGMQVDAVGPAAIKARNGSTLNLSGALPGL